MLFDKIFVCIGWKGSRALILFEIENFYDLRVSILLRILIRDVIKNGIAAYIGVNKKRLSAAKADEAFIIRRERGRYGYA